MQNPQLYGADVKFDSQVNYLNAIMVKINELQFSLRAGLDCTREFSNLLALLTDGIKKPILPEIKKIAEKYDAKVQLLRYKTDFGETTYKWSAKHRERIRGIMINKEQSNAIWEIIPIIVNRLDVMGLLLNREKQTQI